MARWVKLFGAVAIVIASFFGTLFAIDRLGWFGEPCPAGEVLAFQRPFQKNEGYSYSAHMPQLEAFSNTPDKPRRSTIAVCEDDSQLGPPHSISAEIAKKGEGRFTHWSTNVVFSSSDNSDPNKNGRRYVAVRQ